jgi:hypothetical protein
MHKHFKVGRNLEPTDLLVGGVILGVWGFGEGGREGGRLVCKFKERIECS